MSKFSEEQKLLGTLAPYFFNDLKALDITMRWHCEAPNFTKEHRIKRIDFIINKAFLENADPIMIAHFLGYYSNAYTWDRSALSPEYVEYFKKAHDLERPANNENEINFTQYSESILDAVRIDKILYIQRGHTFLATMDKESFEDFKQEQIFLTKMGPSQNKIINQNLEDLNNVIIDMYLASEINLKP